MRRYPEGLPEGMRKVKEAQIDQLCESGQRNLFREMLVDEFRQPLLLPGRQTAAKRPCRCGCRLLQSDEFVNQHDAQRLYILAA